MAYDRAEDDDGDADDDGLDDFTEHSFTAVNDKSELNHFEVMKSLKAIKKAISRG